MKKTYAVLGAGMQGTAAAFDLATYAEPETIWMADASIAQAERNSHRVNSLVGAAICRPVAVDALDPKGLREFLANVDIVLSCVPYWMHPQIAAAAIETRTDMLDLGGNTDVTMQTLSMNEQAKTAEVTIVPDCGLAPGLVNNLGCYCIEHLDEVESVKMYCGVLPQNPKPPFNYKLTFNIEGLVTEYDYQAVTIRDHQIHLVDTLTELETLHIDELGEMEAFVTSGGASTAPYTFKDRVRNYEYKTIRFPGHCERIKIFKDFGFWGEEPIEVDGTKVIPRLVFYKIFGDALARYEDKDMCAVRAIGLGRRDGTERRIQLDIFDRQCEVTGFTSMERLTGFSIAIYAEAVAKGEMPVGCLRYETAMSGVRFVEELKRRSIPIRIRME